MKVPANKIDRERSENMTKKLLNESKKKNSQEATLNSDQCRILIIDDEKSLRKSVKTILENRGFYCETASDFNTATDALKALNFDIILADIVLPDMDGIEMISRLKDKFDLKSAVIFLTGEPVLETALRAFKVGAYDYLEKPIFPEPLVESIKRVLVRKGHEIEIMQDETPKKFVIQSEGLNIDNFTQLVEMKDDLKEQLGLIHDALLELKKKYGESFNDNQRELLNKISQSNVDMKKALKKVEN
jgi:DNA-binding response OmpR family regulator